MPDKRLKVIVTRRLPDPVELRLKELFDTELNQSDTAFSSDQLTDAVKRADVLVSTVTDQVDGRILAQAGDQLRLIAQFGAGVDNIDVQSAIQRGITVTNTPGVLTDDTADVTMALILAVPRRLHEGIELTVPTTVFDTSHRLDLDGLHVDLFYVGPTHQMGDRCQ